MTFVRVNLEECSFLEASLTRVIFHDCTLEGADFRGASVRNTHLRGTSLVNVLGIDSLDGLSLQWPDLLASAGALAGALGISVDDD